MIDTIKLTLSKGMFFVSDKKMFNRSKVNTGRGYATYVQNPTKTELKSGIYKPRLTITNRFNTTGLSEETLSIELSLPKLQFGNNFDELTNDNFEELLVKLKRVLNDMGVRVFTDVLRKSPVSSVHYSKNILLTNGLTPHLVISKIKEANVSLALDVNQTDYRNGYSYKWHCNSYEVTFYDKIKDLEQFKTKGSKRSLEKDNELQIGLFDNLYKAPQLEVLRMEVRLNTRRKIKQLLEKLDIDAERTFEQLFDSATSQRVLEHYMKEVANKRISLLDTTSDKPEKVLVDLLVSNPKIGLLKALQFFGLQQAISAIGTRELRVMFNGYSSRSWYRLLSEAKKVSMESVVNPFEDIQKSLGSFKPTRLVDIEPKMLNNDKYK